MNLSGKSVLITGSSSGVGLHTAVRLAQRGAHVFATMRDPDKATKLLEATGHAGVDVTVLPLDVQDDESVRAAVAQVAAGAGGLDILINNAGFGSVRALEQATPAQLAQVFDVNFHGVARCIRAVLPVMRAQRSGRIVTVSSVGGLVGQPLNELYCAAKFAVEGLVESLATYLTPFFGIELALVEPAGIKTEFVGRVLGDLQSEASPLQDVYGPVFDTYLAQLQKRGAFASSAQTPEQVAEVIAHTLEAEAMPLRVQTSDAARAFAAEKLAGDPDGTALQRRIRADLLGK